MAKHRRLTAEPHTVVFVLPRQPACATIGQTMTTQRSALLVGATGLVGGLVLDRLLADPVYESVTVLVRRPIGRRAERLVERIVDFDRLADTPLEPASDVYLCLGTTIAAAGTRQRFRKVDHDYAIELAQRAHDQGASSVGLVSSVGASPEASSFYLRVKGETERDLCAIGYRSVDLFRPSLLVGRRREQRRAEAVGIAVMSGIAWAMVGAWKRYRPIPASAVAGSMVRAVRRGEPGVRIHHYDQMVAVDGGADSGP